VHRARLAIQLVQLLDGTNLLFFLHAPILEPDLHLALGKVERHGQLDAPPPRQVAAVVELLFQLERLVARVRLAAAPALRRVRTCDR